jgi:hypothetical protein
MQTNDRRAASLEDRDRVAVCDADHAARELPSLDRADEPEGQEEGQPGADDPV